MSLWLVELHTRLGPFAALLGEAAGSRGTEAPEMESLVPAS